MKKLLAISAILFSICFAIQFLPSASAQESTPGVLPSQVQTPAPAASPAVTPTASPPTAAEGIPPEKTFLEKVLEALKSAGGIVSIVVVLFEILVRAFPTKNPLSVLVPVKFFIDNLALVLSWLSDKLLVPLINAANRSQNKL